MLRTCLVCEKRRETTFKMERFDAKITHKFIFKQDVYLDLSLIRWQMNRSFWLIGNVRKAHVEPSARSES